MSAISWSGLETFTSPASTSTASSGDDWFRSFMTSVALGVQPSFAWPGSGGASDASAGVSLFGNARCARAGNSATTGGFSDGFLLLNQNHISLHHIGSTWTALLGHASMVDHATGTRWLTQTSTFTISASSDGSFGTKTITFPIAYSAAPPFVILDGSALQYIVNISAITAGGFSSVFSGVNAIADSTIGWEAEGPA